VSCAPACVSPSPSQAHCGVCHETFSGPYLFDEHRVGPASDRRCREAVSMTDRGLPLRRDYGGVWRSAATRPETRAGEPQTAQSASPVGKGTPKIDNSDLAPLEGLA
jgi:hypothetical protein